MDSGMPMDNMPQTAAPASGKKGMMKWLAIVLGIIIVIAIAWFAGGKDLVSSGRVLGTNTTYQAVFLTNGQVYFGKLDQNGSQTVLRDVYYLQVSQQLQPTGTEGQPAQQPAQPQAQPKIQLVKLGNELHGPQDEMYIDSDKILFWENMKDDSKVVTAIKEHKSK